MDAAGGRDERERATRELQGFLTELRDELRAVVEDEEQRGWFDEELRALLRAAWDEVNEAFDEAIPAVAGTQITLDQLREHGLAGNQLTLKLRLFDRARTRLRRAKTGRRRFGAWIARKSGMLRAYGAFLGIANTILGSLKDLVPAIGAIKEFKECVEKLLSAA